MRRFSFLAVLQLALSFPVAASEFITIPVTQNQLEDRAPDVFGERIAWYQRPDSSFDVYSFDGTTLTRVTNTEVDEGVPAVSG